MSTKTTFKRIALVATAALGFGLLSVVPAQAVGTVTVAVLQNGTSDQGGGVGSSDSTTAAQFKVSAVFENDNDTITVVAAPNGTLADSVVSASVARLIPLDTQTARTNIVQSNAATSLTAAGTAVVNFNGLTDSRVVSGSAGYKLRATGSDPGLVSATFGIQLDSRNVAMIKGTYTFDIVVRSYTTGITAPVVTYSQVTVTRAAYTTEATTASAATSKAWLTTTASNSSATADTIPNVLATVSSTDTPRAYIYTSLLNAASGAASESITVTTTIGQVGTSSIRGKSVTLPYTGAMDINVYSDGNAGRATITIKSTSVTFADKTVVFYAAAPSTLTASVLASTVGAGSTTAIAVDAKDSAGNRWAGTLYTYSSATGVISNNPTSCSYVAARDRHECSVTGVASGTATITVRDAATVAASTVASTAQTLTVNTAAAASVKLSFDKASYAPGEKAYLTVTALDSSGNAIGGKAFNNLFTSTGITFNQAAGNGSDTVNTGVVTTAAPGISSLSRTSNVPSKEYVIYMPATGGDFIATATGGSDLPLAGQVSVTAKATVADSGSSALAAVTALASQVSAFITKINAQITTLTDLVMKIQKKVKA